MRIYKEFTFEGAHFLPAAPKDHPNARIHGHSFRVRVSIDGEPDPDTGLVVHFDDLESALEDMRVTLDHNFLNNIDGLDNPTLELITKWMWDRLHNQVPGLAEIVISRDTCGEGCVYSGPGAASEG